MRLWQFGRLRGNKIKIDEELGQALGLVNGSQVFSAMFRYEHGDSTSYELVLSTFGPENYRQLCQLTIQMIDRPGACAQAAKFLADRNVDILNSVSLSNITGVSMTWKMLADLSYYGEPDDLKAEFEVLKRSRASSVDLVDMLDIAVSHIADRYNKGAAGSTTVRTRLSREGTIRPPSYPTGVRGARGVPGRDQGHQGRSSPDVRGGHGVVRPVRNPLRA
jgi:predicted amino acid-binding ACT domain protein